MDDKKNDVQALAAPDTSNQLDNNISTQIIAPATDQSQVQSNTNTPINQGKTGSKKFRKTKVLNVHQKVATLAIKCYAEQIPNGIDDLRVRIKSMPTTGIDGVQIIAIIHHKDLITDGIWKAAKVKPHIHIIIRVTDRKHRFRVMTMLAALGIVFRPGLDDELIENHGLETVGNYSGYALYLTHETDDAIKDGKEKYDITELFGNLTPDEIEQVRAGYVKMSENRKLSQQELIALDREAYDIGYALKSFTEWYDSLNFTSRSHTKMRTIRESYNRGVDARVTIDNKILRCCIYIQGQPNTGKTYAAIAALAGKAVLSVGGGGSGKFDKLRADHDAIVIDDDVCPNLLNMTDNYICRAYKRNKDNPVWAGQYFVVTSNLSFNAWIAASGIKTHTIDNYGNMTPTAHLSAMRSRFYICDLVQDANGVNHLALRFPSKRGDMQEQLGRLKMFVDFQDKFNATIATYIKSQQTVDYSSYIERG